MACDMACYWNWEGNCLQKRHGPGRCRWGKWAHTTIRVAICYDTHHRSAQEGLGGSLGCTRTTAAAVHIPSTLRIPSTLSPGPVLLARARAFGIDQLGLIVFSQLALHVGLHRLRHAGAPERGEGKVGGAPRGRLARCESIRQVLVGITSLLGVGLRAREPAGQDSREKSAERGHADTENAHAVFQDGPIGRRNVFIGRVLRVAEDDERTQTDGRDDGGTLQGGENVSQAAIQGRKESFGGEDLQKTNTEHQNDVHLPSRGECQLEQLRNGKDKNHEVERYVAYAKTPGEVIDVDALSLVHAVPCFPGIGYRGTAKQARSSEGNTVCTRDGDEEVDPSPDSNLWEDAKKEEQKGELGQGER